MDAELDQTFPEGGGGGEVPLVAISSDLVDCFVWGWGMFFSLFPVCSSV